ncbi:unnamed protein product, partial [Symbiodinium pilosum]
VRPSQVFLFEGQRQRRLREWLRGYGRLSVCITEDWSKLEIRDPERKESDRSSKFVKMLEELSQRRFRKGKGIWEDEFDFQAAVLLGMLPHRSKRKHSEAASPPAASPPAEEPGSPGSDGTRSSQRTAPYLERPPCESDYALDGRADELLPIDRLALWLELRSTTTEEILSFGLEQYFVEYPAPNGENRQQMEAQIRTTPTANNVLSHLQMFRDPLRRDAYCLMLEQLLQHVRARVLSGGRPIYIADMLHIMSAPDTEEPDPTVQEEAVESESSCQSDDIFNSTQHRLFAMFENLLAEHAQHSCTRSERSRRATQVWQAMERGSREEAGHIIQAALLPNELAPWCPLCDARPSVEPKSAACIELKEQEGTKAAQPDLAEAGKQPLPGDAAVLRPQSPPTGHAKVRGPVNPTPRQWPEASRSPPITYYLRHTHEITEAILAASGSGNGPPKGATSSGSNAIAPAVAAPAQPDNMDIDNETNDGAEGARVLSIHSRYNKIADYSAPDGELEEGETGGTSAPVGTRRANTPPRHRRKRRQSQRMADELCRASESSSQRAHNARYPADLNTMD